jgi:hypothetical protein
MIVLIALRLDLVMTLDELNGTFVPTLTRFPISQGRTA